MFSNMYNIMLRYTVSIFGNWVLWPVWHSHLETWLGRYVLAKKAASGNLPVLTNSSKQSSSLKKINRMCKNQHVTQKYHLQLCSECGGYMFCIYHGYWLDWFKHYLNLYIRQTYSSWITKFKFVLFIYLFFWRHNKIHNSSKFNIFHFVQTHGRVLIMEYVGRIMFCRITEWFMK